VTTHRHAFRFKLENGKMITAWAKVRQAKTSVELVLTKEHIERAIALGGRGNTQLCAMAVCSREHGDAFPHSFEFVDWLYSKAYFVTKTKDGLPSECVVYTHHDNIAPLFDSDIGMKKLLRKIKESGSRTINLYPPKARTHRPGRPRGKNTGERQRTIKAKGAALRFARLTMGGVAA
jgi:uncharacterized protein with NRDE domain